MWNSSRQNGPCSSRKGAALVPAVNFISSFKDVKDFVLARMHVTRWPPPHRRDLFQYCIAAACFGSGDDQPHRCSQHRECYALTCVDQSWQKAWCDSRRFHKAQKYTFSGSIRNVGLGSPACVTAIQM